ncbi:transporter substrate-binding domain-containing protein [Anaeromicropila populeti]|uniref:Putative lysine transport system substrate-binding protein n=1 Tax=Anaeromicropila populeti TaxID=37658 RepID=A0A1I6KI25_9FIRM|nr:transporter substrate-binding domain-containing protein [Anaeromicropila populeti]SFR90520.1 putative lysine transport system substrate-binding protein [Anaeromicropila populeti]
MKRKLYGIVCLMALLVSIMVTGCSEKKSSDSSSEKKVLRVGMECAYAPFNWTQSTKDLSNEETAVPIYGTGDYAYGYDVMVAKMIADKLGWELEIHKVDWSSIILGMNSGDYDAIIAGMGYTDERDLTVDFTRPYYIRNNVLLVKAGSELASATSLSDFDGCKATTQIGTTWEKYVPQIPNVKQETYFETTSEIVMAVASGAVDCGIVDEPTAMSAIIANPDVTYVKLEEGSGFTVPEGQSLDVCIAVKEGNEELQKELDQCLEGWTEDVMNEKMDLAITLQPLSK